jgi:hypothetical protein
MPSVVPPAAEAADVTENVTFSPFVIKKTGLQQAQTLLKIDAYSLICIPFQSSNVQVSLLASLSKDEVTFFQRYKGALGGLNMVFQAGTSTLPLKLFARCEIASVLPMKGRENAALINAIYRPCPQDLSRILSEYKLTLMRLKAERDDYHGRDVKISPDTAKSMGYNNYAVLTVGTVQHKAALYSVSSSAAELLLPMHTPSLNVGSPCSLKLYFQRYQFSVQGSVKEALRQPSGVQRLRTELAFSPELVEILGSYFIQQRLERTTKAAKNS